MNPAWRSLVSKAQCFLCLIMPCAKPVISPPMHTFGFERERVRDAEVVTAKTLSHLLGLKDQAVTETNLARCIAQVVATPTAPGVAGRRKQLQYFSSAFAYEERSCPAKVPRCPDDRKGLTIEGDRRVIPMLGSDACAKELVALIQPISRRPSYVCCLTQVADVDASSLLDRPSAMSTSSRHRSTSPSRYRNRSHFSEFIFDDAFAVAVGIDISLRPLSEVYDEGVYWQSLRAMSAGYHLYQEIFCSQPPLFLTSIHPIYDSLGSSITSARIGVAILSALALPGAYLIGRALAGPAAGIAAVSLLVVTPMYLEQSHLLRAGGPATGLLFLTIGAAFMWSEHPTGRRGMTSAILSAVTLALGVLIKLLDVLAVVPIVLLVLARIWHIRHEPAPKIWVSLWPIAAAIVAAATTTLIVLAPFAGSANALIDQVITFHLAAKKMMIASRSENVHTLGEFFYANRVLVAVAAISVLVAVMRRNWRIVPLLAWFLASVILLLVQVPLWSRHAIVLIPPMIAIVVLGLRDLPTIPLRRPISWEQSGALLMGVFALGIVVLSLRQDYQHYRTLVVWGPNSADQWMVQVAADLGRVTGPGQWIITDEQFVAALANRDTAPSLVDTSVTRISSGYLTSEELIQVAANPRVHAVVFGTTHFTLEPVAGFHPWLAEHFRLLRTYDKGIELWTR